MATKKSDIAKVREYLRDNADAERVRISRETTTISGRTYRAVKCYGPFPNAAHLSGWWDAGTVEEIMERIEPLPTNYQVL
jgi:hypothetical protein